MSRAPWLCQSTSLYAQNAREFPNSFYSAPPMSEIDHLVVGAGLTGLNVARTLSDRGCQVTVVDAETLGAGASGVNGGQVLQGFNTTPAKLEQMVGLDRAKRLWKNSISAVQTVREDCVSFDLRWHNGGGELAAKPSHMNSLHQRAREINERFGGHFVLFDKEEAQARSGSKRFFGGYVDYGAGHIDPLAYVHALAQQLKSRSVNFVQHQRVVAIEYKPDEGLFHVVSRCRGSQHIIKTRHVYVCINAWIARLLPQLASFVMPVANFMLATYPLGRDVSSVLDDGACYCDSNFVLNYFRKNEFGQMIFGGQVAYDTSRKGPGVHILQRDMLRVFPQLRDIGISHYWPGLLAISYHRLPLVGEFAPNGFYACAYSGHGLALTSHVGDSLALAALGERENLDDLAALPRRKFPGGSMLRLPLLLAATSYQRMRDIWC